MDKAVHKSTGSSISTTGTTSGSRHYSDTMDNNLKYLNLNFVDNSESSNIAHNNPVEFYKIQNSTDQQAKAMRPVPTKILPPTFLMRDNGQKETIQPIEKSLLDMGYRANEVEGWKNIQPHKSNLYTLLKQMIDQHVKPNVQIRIAGVTFNCHMVVLQCYSKFFMELNNEILVQLPEERVTPGAFKMVYDWMLADEALVQRDGILELFNAANFLRIEELIHQCWFCLGDDECFREDTAFLLYLEARSYGLEILEQLMLMRVCKFFMTLVASKDFLELNVKEICTLLSSNTIAVNTEIEILMSAVRWLSHNWDDREQYLLDVIQCVRFTLMPSWFLVTLINNSNCKEIDRIANVEVVKKMINDGISFVASQMHYGENREEFLQFLDRLQLVAPKQRQWIYDKECAYHHRHGCSNMQYITYASFLEYLELIRTKGKDHWRSVEMTKDVVKTEQCCTPPDSRKVDKNVVAVSPRLGCGPSGQYKDYADTFKRKECQRSRKNHSLTQKHSKSLCVRRTPRGHPKQESCTKKVNSTETETEIKTAVNFKYPQEIADEDTPPRLHIQQQIQYAENILCDNKNYDTTDTSMNTGNTANFRPIVGHDTPVVLGGDEQQWQQRQQQEQQYQQLHHEAKNLQTTTTTDVSSALIYKLDDNVKSGAATDGDDVATDVNGGGGGGDTMAVQCASALNNNNVLRSKSNNVVSDCGIIVEQSVGCQQRGRCGHSPSLYMPKWFPNRKIFIFGGIDPFCSHWQQHEQQRQQLMEQQRKRMDAITTSISVHTPGKAAPIATAGEHTKGNFENFGDQVLVYECPSLDAMEWRHLSHIPFGPHHHHAVAVCHGLIYLVGGSRTTLGCAKKSVFETSIWCFDPLTLKWTLESSLPESRRDFAIVSIEKRTCDHCKGTKERNQHEAGFYVIGGEGLNGIALSSVWFYSVKRKLWIRKASLNMGRYGLTAAMVNNEIWIAGGISNANGNDTVGGASDTVSGVATLFENDGTTATAAAANVYNSKSSTAHVITDTMEIYTLKCSHEILAHSAEEGLQTVCTATERPSGCVAAHEEVSGGGMKHANGGASTTTGAGGAAGEMCNWNVGQWIKSKLHLRIPRVFGKFSKLPNGELYLVGGIGPNAQGDLTSLTDIDQYQVKRQQWQHYGDLNWPRHGHDVGLLNDHCFVVVGGVSTVAKRTLSQVEAFCTKTRQCLNHLPDLPSPVSGCALATLK